MGRDVWAAEAEIKNIFDGPQAPMPADRDQSFDKVLRRGVFRTSSCVGKTMPTDGFFARGLSWRGFLRRRGRLCEGRAFLSLSIFLRRGRSAGPAECLDAGRRSWRAALPEMDW